jgi:hypothetical protein
MEVLQNVTMPTQMKFPTALPAGAGSKPWRNDNPFIEDVDDGVILPPDNEVDFNG